MGSKAGTATAGVLHIFMQFLTFALLATVCGVLGRYCLDEQQSGRDCLICKAVAERCHFEVVQVPQLMARAQNTITACLCVQKPLKFEAMSSTIC